MHTLTGWENGQSFVGVIITARARFSQGSKWVCRELVERWCVLGRIGIENGTQDCSDDWLLGGGGTDWELGRLYQLDK